MGLDCSGDVYVGGIVSPWLIRKTEIMGVDMKRIYGRMGAKFRVLGSIRIQRTMPEKLVDDILEKR